MKLTLQTLSICDCGFPLLDERIPLGTVYEADEKRMEMAQMNCGGCKVWRSVELIYCHDTKHPWGVHEGGYMPLDAFKPAPKKEQHD